MSSTSQVVLMAHQQAQLSVQRASYRELADNRRVSPTGKTVTDLFLVQKKGDILNERTTSLPVLPRRADAQTVTEPPLYF